MFGGEQIQIVSDFEYLGVTWDDLLSLTKHFKKVKIKNQMIVAKLNVTARHLFRKEPQLLKQIYLGVIERIALYGHGAWGHRVHLQGIASRLNSIQRQPLLAMTSSFCTTSIEAMQVLGGVPPLDLKSEVEYSKFLFTALRILHP